MTHNQIKDYLKNYKITSEEELAQHIEVLKHSEKNYNDVVLPLVDILLNENTILLSFFRENQKEKCFKYRQLQNDKIIISNPIAKGFGIDTYSKTLTPHIKFTMFEQETIIEKEQEELSRKHIGHSTRHKANNMTYLDEALENYGKGQKIFENLESKTDNAWKQWAKNNKSVVEGRKDNKEKLPMSVLFTQFPNALKAVIACSKYGHEKYKDTDKDFLNFKRVVGGSRNYADAGIRHRLEEGLDSESGLPHQYHIAWNALAELQLWIEENN